MMKINRILGEERSQMLRVPFHVGDESQGAAFSAGGEVHETQGFFCLTKNKQFLTNGSGYGVQVIIWF